MKTWRTDKIVALGLAMGLVAGWAVEARAEMVGLDWRVRYINLSGTAPYSEGQTVTVGCKWTAVIAKNGYLEQPVQWTGFLLVDGQLIKTFSPTYQNGSGYFYKPGYEGKYGTATNEFDGQAEGTWVAKGPGTHTVRCEIAQAGASGESMTNATKGNVKETTLSVIPVKGVTPAEWPTAPKTTSASAWHSAGTAAHVAIPGGPIPPKTGMVTIGAQTHAAPPVPCKVPCQLAKPATSDGHAAAEPPTPPQPTPRRRVAPATQTR